MLERTYRWIHSFVRQDKEQVVCMLIVAAEDCMVALAVPDDDIVVDGMDETNTEACAMAVVGDSTSGDDRAEDTVCKFDTQAMGSDRDMSDTVLVSV